MTPTQNTLETLARCGGKAETYELCHRLDYDFKQIDGVWTRLKANGYAMRHNDTVKLTRDGWIAACNVMDAFLIEQGCL